MFYKSIKFFAVLCLCSLLTAGFARSENKGRRAAADSIRITVKYPVKRPGDSLYLFTNGFFAVASERNPHRYAAVCGADSLYRFLVPRDQQPAHFYLALRTDRDSTEALFKENWGNSTEYLSITPDYLIGPGAQLDVIITRGKPGQKLTGINHYDYRYTFSGPGADIYRALSAIDQAYDGGGYGDKPPLFDAHLRFFDRYKAKKVAATAALESFRGALAGETFQLLQAFIAYRNHGDSFGQIRQYDKKQVQTRDAGFQKAFKDSIRAIFRGDVARLESEPGLQDSRAYVGFLMDYLLLETELKGKTQNQGNLSFITSRYQGVIKDRLITLLLRDKQPENLAELLADALQTVTDPECLALLSKIKNSSSIVSYNFVLPDTEGHLVRMDRFRGKLVFIDFWFGNCGACQSYYQKVLSKAEQYFADHPGIVFVTISVDKGKEFWLRQVKTGRYTSASAINLYTAGKGLNHPLIDYYNVSAYPTFLIVGRDGRVKNYNDASLHSADSSQLITILKEMIDSQ